MIPFDPRAGVDKQCERSGVAFGKAVFAKPLDLVEAALGEIALVSVGQHSINHLLLKLFDTARVPPRGHCAAQLVGFSGCESRRDHRHFHRLLLKEWNTERLAKYRLQFGLGKTYRLNPVPAAQVGMNHIALDRAGSDNRDLNHQVIEFARAQPREHGHLRPAFDLKDADGVGVADHHVNAGVFGRNRVKLNRRLCRMGIIDELHPLGQRRQHPQRQHVHFENADGVDVVLVPLDNRAVRHAGVFDGDQLAQRPARHDHAADVLAKVTRKSKQFARQRHHQSYSAVGGVQSRFSNLFIQRRAAGPALQALGERVHRVKAQSHCLAYVPHCGTTAIADDFRRHARALAAIFLIEILDHFLAAFMLIVNVDVGWLVAGGTDESLKEHVNPVGINGGDAQAIADGGIRGGAAP